MPLSALTRPRIRPDVANQPEWLCTVPALGVQNDTYNAKGARSVTIRAMNAECAVVTAAAQGLRLDGRFIKTIKP